MPQKSHKTSYRDVPKKVDKEFKYAPQCVHFATKFDFNGKGVVTDDGVDDEEVTLFGFSCTRRSRYPLPGCCCCFLANADVADVADVADDALMD